MSFTRRECLLSLSALLATTAATATPTDMSRSAARVDALCEDHILAGRAAGMAVLLKRDDDVWLAKGYGHANLETRTPASPETVFRIGSVSKQLTAASVLLLAEDRKLSLEDPLAKYLPRFPRSDEVSIRQLLNHTSGIVNLTEGIVPCVDYTTEQIVDIVSRQKPLYAFDPGTRWSYSNTPYALAGSVIEKVTSGTYWDFYAERLFKPAGLIATAIDRHADIVPQRASGYAFRDDHKGFANAPYLSWTIPGPAGALRSTITDLARWHSALFRGRVLEPESLKQMTTPGRLKDGRLGSAGRTGPANGPHPIQEYGLGFEISRVGGKTRIGHYGAIPGFAADMSTFPELGLTVIVLTNSDLSEENPPRNIDDVALTTLAG